MRSTTAYGLSLLVLAGLAWPAVRARHVEAFREGLLTADQATRESGVPVGGRFYRSGELQTAAAPSLTGADAERHHSVDPPYDDPVAVIADFRDRLAERGVDLWVIPAPVRPWIVPQQTGASWAPPAPWIYSDAYDGFVDALREEGVTTIDLLPAFRRRALFDPSGYVHRTDPHWTGKGVVLAARILAQRIRQQPWYDPSDPVDTVATWRKVSRDASSGGIDLPDEPDEVIRLRRIRERVPGGKDRTVDVENREASVLLIGDSYARWYDRYGSDIARQLTHETGLSMDTLPIVGGGATRVREAVARRAWNDEDYLASKGLVIWVFWSENIWSQTWGVVPLEPFEPSKLQRRDREARVEGDLHVVESGRGLASWDHRWMPPGPGNDKTDVTWIRKPDVATLTFPGPVEAGASLILEVRGKGGAHTATAVFDGVGLPPFAVPEGYTRVRLPLPPSSRESHELTLGTTEPRAAYTLGIRNLAVASSRPVWTSPLDTDPEAEGYLQPLTERSGRYATSGEALTMALELPTAPGAAVVRVRARSLRGDRRLSLLVNGTPVMQDGPLPPTWTEQAIAVPAGVLVAGPNLLEWSTDGRGRSVVGDVVEIDAR